MRHDRLPGHGQVQQELTVVVVVRWMIRHPRPVTPDIEDLRGSGGLPRKWRRKGNSWGTEGGLLP